MKLTEGTKVKHIFTQKKLTVLGEGGFLKGGKIYLPCADENNETDDYCKDDLMPFSEKEIENIYLNRLKEQYKHFLKPSNGDEYFKRKDYYQAMRLFCLDTQLLDFNTIEVMESEVNSSF